MKTTANQSKRPKSLSQQQMQQQQMQVGQQMQMGQQMNLNTNVRTRAVSFQIKRD